MRIAMLMVILFTSMAMAVPPAQVSAPATPNTETVNQVYIEWVAPTKNVDGSPLTDLKSFKIYRGTSTANMAYYMTVPATQTSLLDKITATVNQSGGQYTSYSVTAVNSKGEESDKPFGVVKIFFLITNGGFIGIH